MDADRHHMTRALEEADAAAARGEVPIGAVLVDADGTVLATAGNAVEGEADPSAHAEMRVLRAAARTSGRPRLPGTTLYVTLEPCAMCAAAISFARVARLVYAASDSKGGAVENGPRFFEQPTCHHRPVVEHGPCAEDSTRRLRDFFKARRATDRPGDDWKGRRRP